MDKISVKSVCQSIWRIEEKFNLLNKKINGVYFWKLIRNNIFHEVSKQNNLFGQAHTSPSSKFIDKLLYLPKVLINTHLYGALKRDSQKDVLIFEHPRKVKVNNEYIDKYTDYLSENLNDKNYEIISRSDSITHFKSSNENRLFINKNHYLLYYFLVNLNINNLYFKETDKRFILNIQKIIESEFDVKLDLLNYVLKNIKKFKAKIIYYDKLLKNKKPEKVFLVVSYGASALIEACKINDITSIEIQHGTINKYHLGYSFPNNSNIPYFPDQIHLFGQYWRDSTPLPLKKNKLTNYGFPYLEKRLAGYKNYSKIDNQVLFISQGTIGKKLSETAFEFAKNNKNYRIIYKLHPGEYDRWQQDYKILNRAVKLDNFKVIANNNINLYQLFAESGYQVGVYSTAIYEGLTLNCKTVLLDLPGVEYMEYLIEEDIVRLAKNAEEIFQFIREDNFEQNYNKNYFFSGV